MATKSNTFMSWTNVVVSYGIGPTTINLTEITDLQVLNQDGLEPWQADGTKFATQLIAATGTRGITLVGGDVFKLATIPKGTPCTVVGVLNDSYNKTGTGALTVTASNAVIAETPFNCISNKFAGGQAAFMCFSSDGTVDPISYAQAT